MLIDSHCHFDFDAFDGDRESIWQACNRAGIEALIIPAVEPARLPRLFSIADAYGGIHGTAGLHPWWVGQWLESGLGVDRLAGQLALFWHHPRCVAVGECGLDGAIDTPLEQQLTFFERQLQIACDLGLPVIVHAHKAHNEVLQLLKKVRPDRGGVIHGFSGSIELAQSYWRLGFRLGIGGVITYQRARKARQAVTALPLQALLLETDAPDMPLAGRQGEANSPLYLPEVARCLADLRGQPVAEIAKQTTENSKQLFTIG